MKNITDKINVLEGVYMGKETFMSAVYLIIKNEEGKILLQRRQGTKLWPGFLALPAGHIDEGEDAYEAAIREAREELSIKISKDDIVDSFVVNRKNKSLPSYFDVYFEIKSYEGSIKINEPEKCSELKWCDINDLPKDMIDFEVEAIKARQRDILFSTIYTDNEKTL